MALTAWTVMGLTAAGRHPENMRRPGGHTPVYFMAAHVRQFDDAYSLSRAILAVVAMDRTPYAFGGRNLVASLRTKIASNGRIGLYQNSTYWGVLALRAANSPVPTASLNFIRSAQQSNGGYSWQGGAAPDSNDTAAAVMALRSSSIPCEWNAVTHAYSYLHAPAAKRPRLRADAVRRSRQPVDLVGGAGPQKVRPARTAARCRTCSPDSCRAAHSTTSLAAR